MFFLCLNLSLADDVAAILDEVSGTHYDLLTLCIVVICLSFPFLSFVRIILSA